MGLTKVAVPDVDAYAWGEDIAVLTDPLTGLLRDMYAAGYARITGAPLGDAWSLPNQRASDWAAGHAAELVRHIDETSRARLRDVVSAAMADPATTEADLRGAVMGLFEEMSVARADLIATTETAYAAAAGDIAGYRETGVEYVLISDGTEADSECADADGQVWTLDAYDAEPLGHPNCGRSAVAISDEEALERGVDRG